VLPNWDRIGCFVAAQNLGELTEAMAETVAVIHRVLASGSSFPSVVETDAGRLYVLKLSGAGPGRRALAMEYVALKIARNLGLAVPDAQVIDLPRDFPWHTGTDEFYEAVQRSAGANLGVAFIADARDLKARDLAELPASFIQRLAAVDALLQNVDRTAANPNILRDATGTHWAIDFGACLLIERLARGALEPRRDLPSNHFLAGEGRIATSARGIVEAIDKSDLQAIMADLPDTWLEDLGLARSALYHRMAVYLEALRSA
jgi:hypothetical protein